MLDRIVSIFPPSAALLLVAAAGGLVLAQRPGDGPRIMPRHGVIVLRGGQVLKGKITRAGDFYHVVVPRGEIRVRAGRVAYECETVEEAYRRRRAAIRVGSAEEHIELARWCQHNGLLSAAAGELADAMAADPDNPMIPHLERRLKAALEPVPSRTTAAKDRQAGGPTVEELAEMVRRMPPGSVETFTGSVQPLLLNSCTSGGCHGSPSGSGYRLMRGRPGRPLSRRVTQRNLHATLEWIDRKRPDQSRLLVEAVRPHGTAEKPALTKKDAEKYQQIVQWVHAVAQRDRPVHRDARLPKGVSEKRATAGLSASAGWPSTSDPSTGRSAGTPVKRGARIERFVPVDPFDPEIFNRRYHGATMDAEARKTTEPRR